MEGGQMMGSGNLLKQRQTLMDTGLNRVEAREKQVPQYMQMLHASLVEADHELSLLKEDLSMVLGGNCPSETPISSQSPQPYTPIAAELNTYVNRVRSLVDTIKELRARLEV